MRPGAPWCAVVRLGAPWRALMRHESNRCVPMGLMGSTDRMGFMGPTGLMGLTDNARIYC